METSVLEYLAVVTVAILTAVVIGVSMYRTGRRDCKQEGQAEVAQQCETPWQPAVGPRNHEGV